ncbi:MAG TPA: PfkB family carbohydrate kinase [Anaerolineales bacterium]
MNDGQQIDYLLIGHLARDLTAQGPTLGGSVAYAGRSARALGRKAGLYSAADPTLDLHAMQGIPIHLLPSSSSTTFENIYSAQGRRQRLHGRAPQLEPDGLPIPWRQARLVHLAPIAAEVDLNWKGQFENSLLGLSAQGCLRQWDEDGWVSPRPWQTLKPYADLADVIFLSTEDLVGDWDAAAHLAELCNMLIVTDGPRGACLFDSGEPVTVPAPNMNEIDPTGAGDIFAAAFLIHFEKHHDPEAAARFANRLASNSVQRSGLASTPTQDEARRARSEADI